MSTSAVVSVSVFSAFGGIPAGLAALPDFGSFMAFRTSAPVGGPVFTRSSAVGGGFSERVSVGDGGRFKSTLKWSANHFLCFSSLMVTRFPSLSSIGFVCVDLFPGSNLVI
ncbi:unnamed protein product [Heterobilharzia americana]|nr:unnamed protein product [Heterobilharzia americana]